MSHHYLRCIAELRSRFLQVWRVVAQRYRKFEMVAGYEIMSEPRVEENEVDPEVVRDFFAEACRTVHQADPATPCVVGPAPFYHAAHLDRVYLRSNTNVIYVFNFFIPKAFVSGDDRKLRYPGMMRCCDVHDKATRYQQGLCCHNPKSPSQNCCDRKIWVGPELLDQALAAPVAWANTRNVPVIVDQWGVARPNPTGEAAAALISADMLEEKAVLREDGKMVVMRHGDHDIVCRPRVETKTSRLLAASQALSSSSCNLGVQGLNSHRPMVYLVAGSNPNPCPWVRSCRGRHVADLARGASAYLKPHSSRRRGVQAAPRRIAPQRPRALHRNRNPARRAGVSC